MSEETAVFMPLYCASSKSYWYQSFKMLFTDDFHFSVQLDNRLIMIWREYCTLKNHAFVHKSVGFAGGRMMFWARMSINGCTYLYIIRNTTLTDQQYRDEILIVVFYAATIRDDFRLDRMDFRLHSARLVNNFLFNEGIL